MLSAGVSPASGPPGFLISGSFPWLSFPFGPHILTPLVLWWDSLQDYQILSLGGKKKGKKKVEERTFIQEAKDYYGLEIFSATLAWCQRDR